MSDDPAQPASPAVPPPVAPEVMAGLASLHERIDELHQLVGQRLAGGDPQTGAWLRSLSRAARGQRPVVPAWRRETKGELRWPVTVTLTVTGALQTFVPDKLQLIRPTWALPAVMAALMIVLIAANPQRVSRQSGFMRPLGLALGGLLALANLWSVARLAYGIVHGSMKSPTELLVTGAIIWLTNVVVFGFLYWEFDRGGPAARALNLGNRLPDFQFPQMTSPPDMVSPDWEPIFVDYLYLSFTCATAFSPTDVMPLSRGAKAAMTVQTLVSIVTLALVVSRAVNILPS
jgi:hypothetical protein